MTISVSDLSAVHVVVGDATLASQDQSEFEAVAGSAEVLRNGDEVLVLTLCEGQSSGRIIDKQSR